jgi:NADH-quinone oxidoreductase subunit G
VVEFLLINHPLDCPVCDKGGECPLQDITYGWGPGTSRFIEPKRHFRKPLELSPLIAIDRERCILCYRCVRFSQEISEDYQLSCSSAARTRSSARSTAIRTSRPFSGNIIELCPVGRAHLARLPLPRAPVGHRGRGHGLHALPAQCNVELTVRDDRVMRVLARDHDEVDDGWLCDKGRFAYQSVHVDERIVSRSCARAAAAPATWEKALTPPRPR